ncbi:MAG: HEPN domain-containing protein [Polyangiaceae bacterium]|nr:HEPN domain-containing protein [Polyangiaceae bacterium]
MTEDNRRQNLAAELRKGEQSLRAAQALLGLGLWDDAVSRAYYAALHFVRAVLFSAGLEPKSHAGAHNLLYMSFVRPGLLSQDLASRFAALQKYREQADYAAELSLDEAGARAEVGQAAELCRSLGAWLAERGFRG